MHAETFFILAVFDFNFFQNNQVPFWNGFYTLWNDKQNNWTLSFDMYNY